MLLFICTNYGIIFLHRIFGENISQGQISPYVISFFGPCLKRKVDSKIPEMYVLIRKEFSICVFFSYFQNGKISDAFLPGMPNSIGWRIFCDSVNFFCQTFYFERLNRIRLYAIYSIWRAYGTLPVGTEKSLVAPPSLLIVGTDIEVVRGADESARTEERDLLAAVPMELTRCRYGRTEHWDRGPKHGLARTRGGQPNGINFSCVFLFGEESLSGLDCSSW